MIREPSTNDTGSCAQCGYPNAEFYEYDHQGRPRYLHYGVCSEKFARRVLRLPIQVKHYDDDD